MKTLFPTLLITAALASACGKPAAPVDPSSFFRIRVDKIVTVGGGTNNPAVLIQPANNKRWNKEYPASARVTDAGGLAPESMAYDRTAFVVTEPHIRLNVPVRTSNTGEFKVEMSLNFSICDNDGCKDFENVPATIPFEVVERNAVRHAPEPTENAEISFETIRNPTAPLSPELMEAAAHSPELVNKGPVPPTPQPDGKGTISPELTGNIPAPQIPAPPQNDVK